MKLISILSGKGFVMYNKELAHSVSVNGAIIFGQLCSSYESFGSKDMLTIRDGKEFFFLTGEVLEEETALTYKQQLKATKELEDAAYIETKVMGVPSKKYFHITDKIEKELLGNPRSDKREDLTTSTNPQTEPKNDDSSYGKRENLALTKGTGKPLQKGPTIKKKNKKEQYKDIKDDIVNKATTVNNESNHTFKNSLEETIHKLTNEYRLRGLSKEVCIRVVEETKQKKDIENFGAYLRTSLENTLYKSRLKRREISFYEVLDNGSVPFYNWLEDNEGERDF